MKELELGNNLDASKGGEMVEISIVEGDLLEQNTECIVNPWNRNIIPWWLLLPHGVSGAIKWKGGLRPFFELGGIGPLPLGHAVKTSAGKLPFKCIIHVCAINMLWCASEKSISNSTKNAMALAEQLGIRSISFPIIGSGAGGFDVNRAEGIMIKELQAIDSPIKVTMVRYRKS